MSSIYDRRAIKAELVSIANQHPRSASALARALGVAPASAARWLSASHGDVPTPEKWPAIERHYGLPLDHLAKAGGLIGQPSAETEVGRLSALVEDLVRRVEALEAAAGQQAKAPARHLRAAAAGREDPGQTTHPVTGKKLDPEATKARALRNAAKATAKVRAAEQAEANAYAYAIDCGASLRELASAVDRPHMTVKRIAQRTDQA